MHFGLFVFFLFGKIVYGQLSVDELFYFKSKHAILGNCSDLQYPFDDVRIGSIVYNQMEFDCDLSKIIFRNRDQPLTTNCPNDESQKQDFQIQFHRSIQILSSNQTVIHIKPLRLNGIDLSSIDDRIRNVYREYPYYHSRRALLIDIESDNNSQRRHHLALATNGEMTFLICIFSRDYETPLTTSEIEIVFPDEHTFRFNRSTIDVFRIDEGFIHYAQSSIPQNSYQLSKSNFFLYSSETFLLYGIENFNARRLFVTIDKKPVQCRFRYVLFCTFPILSIETLDTHQPHLRISHDFETIVNTTLTLIPRTRLNQVPKKQNLTKISTFEIKINQDICSNHSLASLFTFTLHIRYEDMNGTVLYRKIEEDELDPVNCETSFPIGRIIIGKIVPLSIDDILTIDLDLTHQWVGQNNCRIERTRVHFVEEDF